MFPKNSLFSNGSQKKLFDNKKFHTFDTIGTLEFKE